MRRNICFLNIFFFGLTFISCSSEDLPSRTTEINTTAWAIGNWHMTDYEGKQLKITLYPDGSALSGWNSGKIGNWYIFEANAYIQWKDGWVYIISKKGNSYTSLQFAPGIPTDKKPSFQSNAEKI
jgi:hypothetical protein